MGTWTTLNVMDYGATGNGSTDDTTSIQNAINAAVAGRGVMLFFPSGVYLISSTLTVVGNNVSLWGSGQGPTALLLAATWLTGDVIQFGNGSSNFSSLEFRGMQIFGPNARTSGSGINVNNCSNVIIDDFGMNNMVTGITVQGSSIKVSMTNGQINGTLATTGVGIVVNNGQAGDTYVGPGIVMSNSPSAKPFAGIEVNATGHCSINQCNITSFNYGLLLNPGAAQTINYMFIDHSLFDSNAAAGGYFNAGTSTSTIKSVFCSNSWFSGSATNYGLQTGGISGGAIDDLHFDNCRFLNNAQHGVSHNFGSNLYLNGCTVAGSSQSSSGTYHGVAIAGGVSNVSITNNKIGQAGTASNTQGFGVSIAAGAGDFIRVTDNDLEPNITGPISDASTGSNKQIVGNFPAPLFPKGMASLTAPTAAITTTETQVIGKTFGASSLQAGTTLRICASGTVTSTVATTMRFRVRIGTTTLTGTVPLIFTATGTTTASSAPFTLEARIVIRSTGASGTVYGMGTAHTNDTTGSAQAWATNYVLLGTPASVAVNTTVANVVELTYASSASNTSVTFQYAEIEVVRP